MIPLAASGEIIDASGVAPRIEAALPTGVRRRQLSARTLLAGMCLAHADHRPAHLTRVHQALISLPGDDQRRPGVTAGWKHGPHLLTYRQTEYTFGLVADAAGTDVPDGLPSGPLQGICDALLEASVPGQFKGASTSLAVDWTDLDSFSRPPPRGTRDCADPEASRGHRKNNLLRAQDELFYGYYLSAGIMMPEENGPAVPELARRATCRADPSAPSPQRPAPESLGDILDTGTPPRRRLAIPLAPPQLPGPTRCRPATATPGQATAHDGKTAELARHKLGRLTADDTDGYHRVQCPAAMSKIRCPLRPGSLTLDRDRPEILIPPEHPQACCTQQTITVPADVNAKTRVAVGTALAGGPPHRSQRAGLPHWAPTSGA